MTVFFNVYTNCTYDFHKLRNLLVLLTLKGTIRYIDQKQYKNVDMMIIFHSCMKRTGGKSKNINICLNISNTYN